MKEADKKLEIYKKETTSANKAVLARCELNLDLSEKSRLRLMQEEKAKNINLSTTIKKQRAAIQELEKEADELELKMT